MVYVQFSELQITLQLLLESCFGSSCLLALNQILPVRAHVMKPASFPAYQYKKTTLIHIQLTSLTKKNKENLYDLRSPLPKVDEGALAEKGSTKMSKWSSSL